MRGQQILIGQKAAVFGLMLAGVPFYVCTRMLKVPYVKMRAMLPTEWRPKIRPAYKWKGELLEAARAAYCNAKTVGRGAASLGVTRYQLEKLARQHGWPPRKMGRQPEAHSVRSMQPQERRLYRKLQPIIGRELALKQIFPEART